jgi:hypothetical protein
MATTNPYLELVSDNATQGGVGDNPYTPIVQGDAAQQVRSSVANVADLNPDADAKLQQLAKKYGVPVDAVRLDPKPLERKEKLDSIDYTELARKSPGTANFMGDPNNAAVAHDDTENMSLLETVLNSFKRGVPSLKRNFSVTALNANANTIASIDRVEQLIANGQDANTITADIDPMGVAQMTPEQRKDMRQQSLDKIREQSANVARNTVEMLAIPQNPVVERVMEAGKAGGLKGSERWIPVLAEFAENPLAFIAGIGPESLVSNAPSMALAIPATMLGGPAAGAAVTGAGSFSTSYASTILEALQEKGVDVKDPASLQAAVQNPELMKEIGKTAFAKSAMIGLFDASSFGVASKVGLPGAVERALANKPFTQQMINTLVVQPPVQGALGAAGEFAGQTAAGQEIDPAAILAEFAGEFFGAPAEVVTASSKRIFKGIQEARAAEKNAAILSQLDELATASKVRSRDATTFESFVASATENGPVQDVFINAETLAQSGMAEQLAAVSPSVAEQFQAALDTGNDIRIPVAEYTTTIAGTELSQGLLEHLKTEPEGFSLAEAKQYMQSYAEELKKDIERTLASKQGDETFKVQIESVKTNIKTQLDTAGRFTSQVNDAYSSMIGNFYGVMAGKLGISPDELLARYPLRIQSQSVMGQQYDQAGELKVDTPEFKAFFDGSKVVDQDGKPMVVYHGTTSDVSEFSSEFLGEGNGNADWGDGFYFTNRADAANTYAEGQGGNVMPVYLSLQNPATNEVMLSPEVQNAIADDMGFESVAEVLEGMGYDGIAFTHKNGGVEYVVFNPEQIKSVNNRGTFDANDPNILNQSATLRSGKETLKKYGLNPDGKYKTRQVAAALEARQRAKYGLINPDDRSDQALGKIAKWMAEEVKFEMANPEKSGVGWYSEKFQRALDTMGEQFPELKTDKNSRNLMTALIAITSDGQKVMPNFAQAMDIYGNFRPGGVSEGKFTTSRGHQRQASIDGNLEVIQRLYDMMGPEKLHEYLMQEKTISELKKMAKANGGELKSDYQAHIRMPMAAVEFGPKLGAFYANLMGAHGYLTMDRWWSRTFNRYRGTLLQAPTRQGLDRMKELLGNPEMSDDEVIAATVEYRDSYEAKNFKDGTEIEKAANTIWKAAFDSLEDAPFNATDRTFMLDAVNKAQKSLKRAGYNLSVADIQAILWYYEKRLYGELGARQTADISYEEAASRVVAGYASGSGNVAVQNESGQSSTDGRSDALGVSPGNELYQTDSLEQNKGDARGAFNPATNTITLLKNADLSTFLHESGHFFLEVQFDIAARIGQEAALFGQASNKPGEQQILEDTNALLKWFGVTDLAEWNGLDFEEKRSYHEKFARGYEAYLFEGKAPSIEVQGIFQRFRAWMLNVYKDLKNLNVELTDEVRAVFDRMLATNEQIELAEQGRSMMELFTSPNQAGMTTEEFAAYQALGVDATNDAIQDLQARGLRDLAWARNARGREIKKLQKQAAARRAEVTIDVRREVMSQPIYRAWQFLTGKLEAADKITPPELPKSDPKVLDETIDSLSTAIAKLGGLDRAEVEKQWGFDAKEKSPMPVFGKPLLRREGGLSIDAMAEALAERGYLTKDEDGRFDQRELEDKFDADLRGDTQYSNAVDERVINKVGKSGEELNVEALGAGRFELSELQTMGLPATIIEIIQNLKMTAKNGLHPDIVSDMFGFTSGDELVRTLAIAQEPKQEINDQVDARMLELYGELATPEAIEREADKAIHNENRARVVATEANALAKATGKPKILAAAARDFARAMIARLKIREIRPGQYAAAEVRAAKASQKASQSGDISTAAAEKRNQLVNTYATKAAYDAQDEVESGVRYLKKFDNDGTRKNLDADYLDQIDALLDRFDLRKMSNKAMDKRTALASWLKNQEEQGLEPTIPEELQNEAFRKPYRELTVEEFRGLVDAVKQIEHLGRLKNRLLTAADNRAFAAVRDEIAQSIKDNAGDRQADTRTPTTNWGRAYSAFKSFYASHIKAATLARVMDGGKDGGSVWEYFVRPANERGDQETTMRAQATNRLSEILAPVFALGKMGGKGVFFPSINKSLNREARLALALNTGNEGNQQRLLGGEGWTVAQIQPVLESLSVAEWKAVQEVWDHFESYRPEIGAKERRVYGKEPNWVDPTPFQIRTSDGQTVDLRGGYYPIKYDPAASQRAEEYADAEGAKRQLQGAFTSATTRRSFTKARAEEIVGRPLLYTLAGLYSGVNDVIHDLAWHEWLIDVNRLLRSNTIDSAMRNAYGPEIKSQFKTWTADIAEGDKGAANAGEMALSRLRQGVSAAGLGFNAMSAAMQVLGFTQSIVRVGPTWVGRGIAQFVANPLRAVREVNAQSDFMANRSRTQFRELNELRNRVQDETAVGRAAKTGAFYMMMRAQQMVDVPTWLGAYDKAVHAGETDERATQLADQSVIDAQGGGQLKDLSGIERGGPALKLFTVFYSFMNTALNLAIAQTMTANTPARKAKLAADYVLLFTVPAVLGSLMKEVLTPSGDGDEDWGKLAKKLAAEQISYLMGMMVVVREFAAAGKIVAGAEGARDYQGPAGTRGIADVLAFGKQAMQGDFDDAFRKSAINLIGDFTGLPAAQVNRTITGIQALSEGKTRNPAAVVFGFDRK